MNQTYIKRCQIVHSLQYKKLRTCEICDTLKILFRYQSDDDLCLCQRCLFACYPVKEEERKLTYRLDNTTFIHRNRWTLLDYRYYHDFTINQKRYLKLIARRLSRSWRSAQEYSIIEIKRWCKQNGMSST